MIIYSILILTKFIFVFYLSSYFLEYSLSQTAEAIFYGYKFDFATSAIVSFVLIWFNYKTKLWAILSAILISTILFLQIGDIFYFNESSRHIGYEITDIFLDASSLLLTAYEQHTFLTLLSLIFSIALSIGIYYFFKQLSSQKIDRYYAIEKLLFLLLTIFFLRGMTQAIPLNPWQSNQIGDNKLAPLVLNASYNVIYTLINKKKKLDKLKLPFNNETLKDLSSFYCKSENNQTFPIIKTQPNVVFLFLESWSAKFLKSYGYKYQTTPFFDSILEQSLRSKMMIAGGHRTTEGMFATLVSFQNPLGKSVAKTQLQSYEYTSIIDLLNKQGYRSAFFQGTAKETSGTGSLANSLGFKNSYGKKDIKKRQYEENAWGVQDTDLYAFAQNKLKENNLKEPFVIGINGASTHDDKTPKGYKKSFFSEDKNLNKQLNALAFSDEALGHFIEKIEQKFPNTIFVFLADHCGGKISDSLENYQIPFAIYSKSLIKPQYIDSYISQRDIAPTVCDLVIGDYKTKKTSFSGQSLMQDKNFFADYFHNGLLAWIEKNKMIELNIINNENNCFILDNFKKKKTLCTKEYQVLKNKALLFTSISQTLLFNAKVNTFKQYRTQNEK